MGVVPQQLFVVRGLVLSLILLISCEGHRLRLSSTNPVDEGVSEKTLKALQTYFAIQYVGYQNEEDDSTGVGSPFDPSAECLAAGGKSDLDGVGIHFEKCESVDLGTAGATVDPDKRLSQQFSFTLDGAVRSKKYGKCIRRALCQDRYVYDLASCDEVGVARFKVSRSIANSKSLKPLGRPLHAMQYDGNCEICGPYNVLQVCKGEEVEGSGTCYERSPTTGWTKGPSQYIPPKSGEPGRDLFGSAEKAVASLLHDNGMGKFRKAYCNTSVGDGADSMSYFYFKKMK